MYTDTACVFFGMSSSGPFFTQKMNFRVSLIERLHVAINLIYDS